MSQNNIPPNDDANNADSSPGVLDTTGAGGPHIPRRATGGASDPPASSGGSGGAEPQPPPPEELVIEVEIAPEVQDIDALLAGIHLPASPISPSHENDFVRVARTHGVITAQSVFTREEVKQHRARLDALRASSPIAPSVGGPSEQLDRLAKLTALSNYVQLRFPPGTSADAVIAQLKALPQVKRVAVVPEVAPPSFPTDVMIGTSGSIIQVDPQTQIEKQWYLHRTRVPQAWQHAQGENVVIADLDFGVRASHREFVGAIERTRNTFDKTNDVTAGESFGHGTGVLGIAGARSNAEGVAGYAPKAKLWAIQGNTGNSPQQSTTPWSDGIKFVLNTAAPERRKVLLIEVQMRDGGNIEQVYSIHQLIRQAIAENCVVVVPAGNGDRPVNLASNGQLFDGTGSILVGATIFHETENKRADFSNFGPNVVVSAPGDQIHDVTCGQTADNSYRNGFGGTSGAAAKVAGAVALMLSVNKDLSHDEVRDILRATGSPIITDPNKPVGAFLNAEAAVLEALNRLNN